MLVEVAEQYPWKGNVRELNNFLERCLIYYRDRIPTKEQLIQLIQKGGLIEFQETSDTLSFKEQIEKENIYNALVNNNGNIPMAAKQLSISKSTLYRKIKKYKLD